MLKILLMKSQCRPVADMKKQPLVPVIDNADHRCRKIDQTFFVFGFVQAVAHQFVAGNHNRFDHGFPRIAKIGIRQQISQSVADNPGADFAVFGRSGSVRHHSHKILALGAEFAVILARQIFGIVQRPGQTGGQHFNIVCFHPNPRYPLTNRECSALLWRYRRHCGSARGKIR